MEYVVKTKRPLTYDDYAAMPDDKRYELIWGEIVMAPSPDTPHQMYSGHLHHALMDFVLKNDLGWVFSAPYDVVFDEHTTVEPDLIFVSKARSAIITPKNIQGAPDLLIEIISPNFWPAV